MKYKKVKRINKPKDGSTYVVLQNAKGFKRIHSFVNPGETIEFMGDTYRRTSTIVEYTGKQMLRLYKEE